MPDTRTISAHSIDLVCGNGVPYLYVVTESNEHIRIVLRPTQVAVIAERGVVFMAGKIRDAS